MLHKCNETDKSLFSQNIDYVDPDLYEIFWPQLQCLDNPEKVVFKPGETANDATFLYIGAYIRG